MSRFEYIIKKIETSRLKINPFKHVYIDNFLKKNDYDELINNVPLDKNWDLSTKKNKALRRKSWQLQTYSLNPKKIKIISELNKVFESKEFCNGLLRLFRIKANFKNGIFKTAWCRNYDGFTISPHKDQNDKILSCLFYLATDNSNKENGTQILKPIKNVKKFGDKHMRWYDFKKVDDIEFIKNRFVCWSVNDKSFHSVDVKIDLSSKHPYRDTVRAFYFKNKKKLPELYTRYK